MPLFTVNEFKGTFQSLLDHLKNGIATVADNTNLMNLGINAGPQALFSFGLPVLGILLYKKKRDSPTARKIAAFLGIDVAKITEKEVFEKISSDPAYYQKMHGHIIKAILNQDIAPLKEELGLTDTEAWEVCGELNKVVLGKEMLEQLYKIIPQLEAVQTRVDEVKKSMTVMMELLKSPVKISNDPNEIILELGIVHGSDIAYAPRKEDGIIKSGLDDSGKDVIIVTGGPGSGKSKSLENSILHCQKSGFDTFVFIKNFFREGDERNLDHLLSERDNMVIVWDDLHERKTDYIVDVIRRLRDVCRFKNYKILCAARKDIFISDAYNISLEKFSNEKLITDCSNIFNVKLSVSNDRILQSGDGTPYYIVSLFKMHKNKEISENVLSKLPHDVVKLWHQHIVESIQAERVDDSQIDVFRTIGLLSHSYSPQDMTFGAIERCFSTIFGGNTGMLDESLRKLVENEFVSSVGERYEVHDSHIEALEQYRPVDNLIPKFLEIEADINNLFALASWAYYKNKYDIMLKTCDRVLEVDPRNATALNNKGLALASMEHYNEALTYYDRALEVDPKHVDALYNKGLALANLQHYNGDIIQIDKGLEVKPEKYATALNNKG
ncbi:MAG: tetratricopeptide repeat protein, partial [Candidatus Nitrosotenuis sp.]